MYVDPGFRRRGVGRKLLDRLLSHAANMPALHKITLGVNAANPGAIALYEAAGFESFGIERPNAASAAGDRPYEQFMDPEGISHDHSEYHRR